MDNIEFTNCAEQFTDIMQSLTEVLDTEVALLYTARNADLEPLYKHKTDLLAAYAGQQDALVKSSIEDGHSLPPELKARVLERSEKLNLAMKRNMQALAVANTAAEGVVNVIINEVKRQRHTGSAYIPSRHGTVMSPPAADSAAQAVTFNERL